MTNPTEYLLVLLNTIVLVVYPPETSKHVIVQLESLVIIVYTCVVCECSICVNTLQSIPSDAKNSTQSLLSQAHYSTHTHTHTCAPPEQQFSTACPRILFPTLNGRHLTACIFNGFTEIVDRPRTHTQVTRHTGGDLA